VPRKGGVLTSVSQALSRISAAQMRNMRVARPGVLAWDMACLCFCDDLILLPTRISTDAMEARRTPARQRGGAASRQITIYLPFRYFPQPCGGPN